jgi:hypothetical protein
MADQERADTEPVRHRVPGPLPVTPSGRTERPEGLAFDVEPGADLTGVPGDQIPALPPPNRRYEKPATASDWPFQGSRPLVKTTRKASRDA